MYVFILTSQFIVDIPILQGRGGGCVALEKPPQLTTRLNYWPVILFST